MNKSWIEFLSLVSKASGETLETFFSRSIGCKLAIDAVVRPSNVLRRTRILSIL
jgi:hypothetical protein